MGGSTTNRPVRPVPPDDVMLSLTGAYERGLTVTALEIAQAFAPLQNWGGVGPCVLAARIAANVGAPRLATKLSVRAHRADPSNIEALTQYSLELLSRRGPLAVWQRLRDVRVEHLAPGKAAAELLAIRGRAAIELRDFATGEQLIARAESLDPERPWIRLQRALLLEWLDRVEEALALARSTCELHPHPYYRPAVQTCAHLLQLLDRDDEAIELLMQADGVLQNAPVAAQLYALLSENGRWAEAERALARFAELAALLEPAGRKWLDAQRTCVAYHLGKRAEAAAVARTVEGPFHAEFSRRLLEPPAEPERLQLDVSFVRQHFKTCAPATLAAIGRYWRLPSDHLQLAEAMCYDGTPAWQQRDWAEHNGWHVREFRVTHESAHALLARGVPFAVSVMEATYAHMMAVIGFDRARGVLLLRDPSQPYVIEWPADEFLNRYAAFGPRGMVFVPLAERARLDDLKLPEATLYDHYHKFSLALSRHDRATAAHELENMQGHAPEAALTWDARLDLAFYDDNGIEQARCLDKLHEMFPGNAPRLLRRLDCMVHSPREERVRLLRAACAAKDADPALFIALVRALQGDARNASEAQLCLRRALRARPRESSVIKAQADLLWTSGDFEKASEAYRFAAFLEGFREHLYQSWFIACRQTRRTEEALKHLQDRYERFGTRSEQPALTLAWAWNAVEQPQRAREVLQEAIRLRPGDGALLLRAAGLIAELGSAEEAGKLLQEARGKVRESDWLRARMEVAEKSLDFGAMLALARELRDREPIALDAHAALARALSRREGPKAARAALREACARFPHHCGLRRLLVEWTRAPGPEALIAAVQDLLRLEPSDAWAHRELAQALVRLNRVDEALRAAQEAARIEPGDTYSDSTLGFVYQRLGRIADARARYRAAVSSSVDNNYAIHSLLDLARSDQERKDDIAFIEQELLRQVVNGDGLLAYLEIARPILDSGALLSILRRAHAERPDLWHAWAALTSQLMHAQELDEALTIATQATQRFPHLPRLWLDLATVHQRRGEPEAEIAALERAFEVDPSTNSTVLALADAYERVARMQDARRTYERALRYSAFDPVLHAAHASLLWRERCVPESFAALEQALRLAPAYEFAWDRLCDWSAQLGDGDRAGRFARALAKEHSGEPRLWLMLARILPDSEMADRLAAVDRSLELDPQNTDAWDLKAQLLTISERFEDAIRTCEHGATVCHTEVHILAGRRAWIEAQRRRPEEAIRLMREVLAENASYAWGWHQLVSWLIDTDKLSEATAALEEMRLKWPHNIPVSRQLAFLLRQQGHSAAARSLFAKVLELSPTDVGVAHTLLALHLQASDIPAAAETLHAMQIHQPGATTLAAEIVFSLRTADVKRACRAFQELCTSPDPDPWAMDVAVEEFQRTRAIRKALRVAARALESGQPNPQTAAAVVRLLGAKGGWLAATWRFLRLPPGELQRRAAGPLVQMLTENRRVLLLRWLLWRRRDVLHQEDDSWAHVGYTLLNFGHPRRAVSWLSDWRKRANVHPWTLFNYCLALRQMGRYEEATETARYVIERWEHREGALDMHLFLAVEAALAGETEPAREHLQHTTVRRDVAYDQQLFALAKALVEVLSTAQPERPRRFSELQSELDPHFAGLRLFRSGRDVRQTFARAAEAFHRAGAGPRAWLWFRWRMHWRWSLVALTPGAAALAIVEPEITPALLPMVLVTYAVVRSR